MRLECTWVTSCGASRSLVDSIFSTTWQILERLNLPWDRLDVHSSKNVTTGWTFCQWVCIGVAWHPSTIFRAESGVTSASARGAGHSRFGRRIPSLFLIFGAGAAAPPQVTATTARPASDPTRSTTRCFTRITTTHQPPLRSHPRLTTATTAPWPVMLP